MSVVSWGGVGGRTYAKSSPSEFGTFVISSALMTHVFSFPPHILRRKYALPHCVPPRQKEAGSLR